MARLQIFRPIEVRNRARHFQDAIMRSRGKPEAPDRSLQHFFAFLADSAEFPDQFRRHLRVRENFSFARIAFGLALTGAQHAFADRCGILGRSVPAQFLVLHGGHFDVNVDAVEQGAGNLRDVTLDLWRAAMAFARGIAEKAAGLRVTS